jgi:O-antigen ligase
LFTLVCLAVALLWAARVPLAQLAAGAWLAAALISCLLGLLQYFGASAVFGSWINSTDVGEVYANLRQRNQFATLTNIGLAALLWSVAQRPSTLAGWRWLATLAITPAALLAIGNAASSSRTGLLQLVVLVVLCLWWGGWRQPALRWVLAAALLAYAVAAALLPMLAGLDANGTGILVRLQDGDSVCGGRRTLWSNVTYLIAQKPWSGWGWGELDFAHFITLYPGVRFCDILDNAHNLPLHLAVELGVPVAVAVGGTALYLLFRAKPWREADATRQLAWSVLALILVHSMLEYPLWYGPFQVAAGLSVWLLWRRTDLPAAKPARYRTATLLVPLMLLVAAGYAAWDYQRVSQIYLSPPMRLEAYRDDTLTKISDTWLFRNPVRFAELTITPLTRDNADHLHQLATELLHFSPEARVVEKLIESAELLGRDEEVGYYMVRYQAAFPDSYAHWIKQRAQ